MVSLTFYGGVDEIGGNKIVLQDDDVRVWLDFGQSFTLGQDYYTGWLQPRRINGLGDYFEFDLLPQLPGLYSRKMLENTSLGYEEPGFDGVFVRPSSSWRPWRRPAPTLTTASTIIGASGPATA
jgi:ribonuclease J